MSRSSPRSRTRSPMSWPSRSPIRHSSSTGTGTCGAPTRGRSAWSSSCSERCQQARSTWPTLSSRRPSCGRSSSTGRRSRSTSSAACRPRPSPTAHQNRPRCWRASSPMKVCANCRARPPWRRHHGPCCRFTCTSRGLAPSLHDHRHPRHAAGHHGPGDPDRELLPDRRADGTVLPKQSTRERRVKRDGPSASITAPFVTDHSSALLPPE